MRVGGGRAARCGSLPIRRRLSRKRRATQQAVDHLLDFEALKAEPDQLVSYFIWAEDIGPDGKPRRTESDMYFAEVRPFDEIFRQGEQPTQNAAAATTTAARAGRQCSRKPAKLAELQKEIINATWKLIRRETRSETDAPSFRPTASLLEESQQSAIERLSETGRAAGGSRIAGPRANRTIAHGRGAEATDLGGRSGRDAAPLRPALSAEQAAYQALLKLRAREFQVVRGAQQQRRSQRGAGRQQPSQRQLDQLELSADENRYETQSRATNPEENAGPARVARSPQPAARPGPPAGRPQRAAARAAIGAGAGQNAAGTRGAHARAQAASRSAAGNPPRHRRADQPHGPPRRPAAGTERPRAVGRKPLARAAGLRGARARASCRRPSRKARAPGGS